MGMSKAFIEGMNTSLESNKSINGIFDAVGAIGGSLLAGFRGSAASRIRGNAKLGEHFDADKLGSLDALKSFTYDDKGEFSALRAGAGLSGAYIAGNWLLGE